MLSFMPIFSQNLYVYEFWSLHAPLPEKILYYEELVIGSQSLSSQSLYL